MLFVNILRAGFVFLIAAAVTPLATAHARDEILLAQATTNKTPRTGQEAPAATGGNWIVNCTGSGASAEMRCEMFQQVLLKDTNQRLLRFTILPQPNSDQDLISLAMPHGLVLQNPLRLQVDDNQPIPLPYTHSDGSGVYANAVLKPEWLDSFRRGNELKVIFDTVEGKTITVNLSLQGFTSASQKYASF